MSARQRHRGDKNTDTGTISLDTLYLYLYSTLMDSVRHAITMLKEAEGRLRRLMQDEISSGSYSELPALASLADGISSLIDRAGTPTKGKEVDNNAPAPPMDETARQTRQKHRKQGQTKKGGTPSANGAKRNHKYPYFEICDDRIGKVGWSKKNREEYRHYAPVSAAAALAEHVDKTQQSGRVWTVEDLGAVVDAEAGEALPSYQLYLVIAWMRSADLLTKQGRSGYVASGGGKLRSGVQRALASAR